MRTCVPGAQSRRASHAVRFEAYRRRRSPRANAASRPARRRNVASSVSIDSGLSTTSAGIGYYHAGVLRRATLRYPARSASGISCRANPENAASQLSMSQGATDPLNTRPIQIVSRLTKLNPVELSWLRCVAFIRPHSITLKYAAMQYTRSTKPIVAAPNRNVMRSGDADKPATQPRSPLRNPISYLRIRPAPILRS